MPDEMVDPIGSWWSTAFMSAAARWTRCSRPMAGALLAAMAACGGSDGGYTFEADMTLELDVTADVPFDRMVVLVGGMSEAISGVVTPGMLLSGEAPPASAVLYDTTRITRDFDHRMSAEHYEFTARAFTPFTVRAVLAI